MFFIDEAFGKLGTLLMYEWHMQGYTYRIIDLMGLAIVVKMISYLVKGTPTNSDAPIVNNIHYGGEAKAYTKTQSTRQYSGNNKIGKSTGQYKSGSFRKG